MIQPCIGFTNSLFGFTNAFLVTIITMNDTLSILRSSQKTADSHKRKRKNFRGT